MSQGEYLPKDCDKLVDPEFGARQRMLAESKHPHRSRTCEVLSYDRAGMLNMLLVSIRSTDPCLSYILREL